MRRLLRALLAAALPAVLLVSATPGEAEERLPSRCIPTDASSPACHWRKAQATFVADGDTIDVNEGGRTYRVRFTGLNAMEMSVYSKYRERRRGECQAVAATNRLEDLINEAGGVVYLAAQDLNSKSGFRYRRAVWTNINGVWRDLGLTQLQEGRALWAANADEWAHREYNWAAQAAAAAGRGLYSRTSCGTGPSQSAKLSMWVNWDADGPDDRNVNGEWVRIRNLGKTNVSIGGWWFRDSFGRRYTFPKAATVAAGKAIMLHIGKGTNTAARFHWGQSVSVFNNIDPARGLGEGGYLFDPQGDLRSWSIYPCVYRCASPLTGKVDVKARAKKPEYINIRNVSRQTVNLRGHVLKTPPYSYHFLTSTPVPAGKSLRVYLQGSPKRNTALTRYWGHRGYVLNDRSDVVTLRSYSEVRVDCHRWGATALPCSRP